MDKWEYTYTSIASNEVQRRLNALGQDGWEAVNMIEKGFGGGGGVLGILLKRKVR